jgi:hypothetical protein
MHQLHTHIFQCMFESVNYFIYTFLLKLVEHLYIIRLQHDFNLCGTLVVFIQQNTNSFLIFYGKNATTETELNYICNISE